jgi:hypothetical protein
MVVLGVCYLVLTSLNKKIRTFSAGSQLEKLSIIEQLIALIGLGFIMGAITTLIVVIEAHLVYKFTLIS